MLKSQYIPPKDRRRIDEVLQIFVDEVEVNFRWTQMEVENGFTSQTSNKFQRWAKAIANSYSAEFLDLLGIRWFNTSSHVSTQCTIVSLAEIKKGRLMNNQIITLVLHRFVQESHPHRIHNSV